MKTRTRISAILLGAALAAGPALGWGQQDNNRARQDMRDAGHESKDAARDAGRGTKRGTKKAYHATKRGTTKAWNKTRNTTTGAVHGAKEGAKEPPR